MLEKRKLQRRHLIYYLKVMEQDTDKQIGFLVDITTQGIMIMSESPVEVDKTYHFRMLLQTEMNDQEYLNFDAKSIWCNQSINTDFYDTGFELIDVTPEDFKGIKSIIEELGFKD